MQNLLGELLAVEATPKITLQIPASSDAKQRALTLRHLLELLARRLVKRNLPIVDIEAAIERAGEVAEDPGLVMARSGTAAVYLAGDYAQAVMWPSRIAERAIVDDEFYLADVVSLFDQAHCYVLTLSRGGAALYRADATSVDPIELVGVPADLAEATQHLDPERQLQFHQGQSAGRGAGGVVYHGHGIGEGRDVEELRNYLRAIDRGVRDAVAAAPAPLALVGSDDLPAEYIGVTQLDVMTDQVARKNPGSVGSDELHQIAVSVLAELRTQEAGRIRNNIMDLLGTGKASQDIAEVAAAAAAGKVEALLISPGGLDSGDEQAVNLATVETLRHGGAVHPDSAMPAAVEVAALFRY
jgi:hypothetical protein